MEIKEIQASETYPIRQQALYPNDSVDKVILPDDAAGRHLGVFVRGECVSVLSLFQTSSGIQLRKFGTLPEHQGKGYGTKLLRYALEQAPSRVYLNARSEKMDFYRKFGFSERVETFSRNGFTYCVMEKGK